MIHNYVQHYVAVASDSAATDAIAVAVVSIAVNLKSIVNFSSQQISKGYTDNHMNGSAQQDCYD